MRKWVRPTNGRAWFKTFNKRNPQAVAWHRYVPSNRVPGGPVDDDITREKSPVTHWLDGRRPNPVGEITKDSFAGPGKMFTYTEPVTTWKRISIRLTTTSRSLWLYYRGNECYFVLECRTVMKQFTSQTYPDKRTALRMYEAGEELSWVDVQPL